MANSHKENKKGKKDESQTEANKNEWMSEGRNQ
jgi:hypothetical protein